MHQDSSSSVPCSQTKTLAINAVCGVHWCRCQTLQHEIARHLQKLPSTPTLAPIQSALYCDLPCFSWTCPPDVKPATVRLIDQRNLTPLHTGLPSAGGDLAVRRRYRAIPRIAMRCILRRFQYRTQQRLARGFSVLSSLNSSQLRVRLAVVL